MVEIKLKEDIIFNSFDDQKELKKKILNFIKNAKTDKILYKGDPQEINYKLLKKIIPQEDSKNFDIKQNSNLRISFNNFVQKVNGKYILIYKI
ncbi:MAG: hypothetical protein ACOCRK_10430 [bacterium]